MNLHEFRDTAKKLRFIDRQEWMSDTFWRFFRTDPVRSFVTAADDEAEKLWEMIKPREAP